jgi:hypothetical protein
MNTFDLVNLVNLVELVEKNSINKLSNSQNNKLLLKINNDFTNEEQKLFISFFLSICKL